MERIRSDFPVDQVARLYYSPRERADLAGLPVGDRLRAAFECWTRKEAYLKAVGVGLTMPLDGFDDLRVHRAISLAIDRERLVKASVAGRGRATWGPLPAWDPWYEPAADAGRKTDKEQADRLLSGAGWTRAGSGVREQGGKRLEFECVVQDDDVHRRLAGDLRLQLAEIGVGLLPHPSKPFKEFYAACEAGPASFINKWLWPDAMDAIIGFNASWCRPFPNAQQASIPELDEAFHAWVRATDEQEMKTAAGRAQRLFVEHVPCIPLLTPEDIWVVDRRVRGFLPYPATLYPFYHSIRIEQ